MNQVERDLTYRLDALKAGCDNYGWESEWCRTSMEIWQSQHNMNVWVERFGETFWIFGLVAISVILILVNICIQKANNHKEDGTTK